MPLTPQLKKLKRLANTYTPEGVFDELETLQTQNEQLEQALLDAQNTFKTHIQAIDDILTRLERNKLNTSEFQAFGVEVRAAITGIKLIPGPKGDKPIAGVDYPIPRDADPLVAAEIASRIVKAEVKEEIKKDIPPPVVLDNADQIRNKLETLTGDTRLAKEAIKGLEKLEEDIKKAHSVKNIGGLQGLFLHVDSDDKWLVKSLNIKAGTNVTLSHAKEAELDVLTINASSAGSVNLATESVTATQDGTSSNIDLTQLANVYATIMGVFYNGQLLNQSRWSILANVLTVTSASASKDFQIQYVY